MRDTEEEGGRGSSSTREGHRGQQESWGGGEWHRGDRRAERKGGTGQGELGRWQEQRGQRLAL